MDQTKQPGINFDGIILKEITFSRQPEIIKKFDLQINFHSNISFSAEHDHMIYELQCNVDDNNGSFKFSSSMLGLFSIVPGSENMSLEDFSQNNAPAVIFPYIREVLASTTLRAGISSVLLPPLNIQAIIKKTL